MYRERSAPLKKRFNKLLGEQSYYRWEGHDSVVTGSDYFVVVGPAIERSGQKSFFAGIKKLPFGYKFEKKIKAYAPNGKYFPTMISALSHASKMWGTPFPPDQTDYTRDDLESVDIPRHIKG